MRIKKIIVGLFIISSCILFMGCGREETTPGFVDFYENGSNYFLKIQDKNNLYYDKDTKIVYYIYQEVLFGGSYFGYSYSYITPYFAENGLPYRYVDGKLVEIE